MSTVATSLFHVDDAGDAVYLISPLGGVFEYTRPGLIGPAGFELALLRGSAGELG